MCGLAGAIGFDPTDDQVGQALRALAHRGPDGSGAYRRPDVCLLHTRLAIIDLSASAAQPMVDPATGVTIVFNGEIYNYRELRRELGDEHFRTHSDTEVLLRLFLSEGVACIPKLRGMFGFAIWDPRSRELHLGRDRFGIKPLFVHRDGGKVVFGSEIKALIALGVPARPNLQMVRDYLVLSIFAHRPETFFEGVESLPPGTVTTFSAEGAARCWRYFSPLDAGEAVADEDVEEVVWERLRDSVAAHMVSDVPVGVSLSAGLDSQMLMHVLAANGAREVHTFSYGFDDPAYDEIIRIDKVSFPLTVHRHNVRLSVDTLLDDVAQGIVSYEAPIGGVGAFGIWAAMRLAREAGVKVVLTGEGSDEVFGGYKYYYYSHFRDLLERGETARLKSELEAFGRINGDRLEMGSAEFAKVVEAPVRTRLAPDGTSFGAAYLSPLLAGLPVNDAEMAEAPGQSHLRAAMLRDLMQMKVPRQLWYDDRGSMAWGVEARVPFLDHRLFAATRNLSSEWLIRDGVSKWLPKRLLSRFAGVDYTETPKHFVSNPQREWLKGPLAEPIMGLLADGALAQSGLIDLPAFLADYRRYAAQPELGNSFFVWKMLNLEALLRAFFPSWSPR